jgi:hypothetical protein
MFLLSLLGDSISEFKKNAPHNTDNMGKLFVTVFAFAPAPKTNL